LVGAGRSLLTSNEILDADSGFAVNVSKVFMKPDTYPRFWK
jgi:H/ACA ribonucleoprotein complex subunit 4